MSKESFSSLFETSVHLHQKVLEALVSECSQELERIGKIWKESLTAGRRIFFIGNGGSAADAQHLAAELVVRFRLNRQALPGLALTTDTSVLTACANDFGFEDVFSRQLEAFAQKGDVLVAISTSGKSPNIIKAACYAQRSGMKVIIFCGKDPGVLKEFADVVLAVPCDVTAHIQECHIVCGHVLCEWVEKQ